MKKVLLTVLAAALSLTTGCASVASGSHEGILVDTAPVRGATCVLSNSRGSWRALSTPEYVVINKAFRDLTINCTAPGGFQGNIRISAGVNGWIAGNLLLPTSILGAGVDAITGAAFMYPHHILVPMVKVGK